MGHWIEDNDERGSLFFRRGWRCSTCGDRQTYGRTPYCPYCGEKMDREREDETDDRD